ncbi:MAG: zinc dependent phospholipase C family protein [Terracidiphilus sp.]
MKVVAGFVSIGVLLDAQETVPQRVAASNLRTPLRCNGARHKVKPRQFQIRILLALVVALCGVPANAYSLLTHEELIDLNWQYSIVPLLLSRYPTLTLAQLDEARAYAYGGCVIQDMGYYPFGDKSFSNLTHYVRSGDLVVNLFRNAHSADELAFAVGALSHYVGDSIGHSEATNLSVPVEFPRLREKYGHEVSYAEGEHQHVQTEFAFDIDEIAHHRMAPVRFLRHIGLKVPVKQLALAYYQTYGLSNEFSPRRQRFNVREYRFMVHTFFPRVAYAITLLRHHHEPAEPETPDAAKIDKEVAVVAAENDWQKYGRHAGIGTYMLAGVLFILPKFGPLKLIDVKGPTPATEAAYLQSVVVSTTIMHQMLARFTPPAATPQSSAPAGRPVSMSPSSKPIPAFMIATPYTLLRSTDLRHPLPNRDLDTGRVVEPGGYSLTDRTYANLLHRLTRQPARPIPPGIKQDIQAYYADPNAPITTKQNPAKWAQVQADLATLAAMPTSTEPQPYPTYGDDIAASAE